MNDRLIILDTYFLIRLGIFLIRYMYYTCVYVLYVFVSSHSYVEIIPREIRKVSDNARIEVNRFFECIVKFSELLNELFNYTVVCIKTVILNQAEGN